MSDFTTDASNFSPDTAVNTATDSMRNLSSVSPQMETAPATSYGSTTDSYGSTTHDSTAQDQTSPYGASYNSPLSYTDHQGAPMKKTNKMFLILICVAIIGGITTGAGLSALSAKGGLLPSGETAQPLARVATGEISNGQVFGSTNESIFKDNTEGYLVSGGVEGEGSHHLLKPGGPTQTVYMTSSVTDLSKFEGMCVKVWGETFQGQKAGWLMDVGRVQVIDTKCQTPFDENQAKSGTQPKASGKSTKSAPVEDAGE